MVRLAGNAQPGGYRRLLWRVAAAGLLCCAPALTAQSRELCRTFAVTPKTFGGLKLKESKRYDDPRYGTFAKYTASGQILTVFKYDDGQKRITDSFLQSSLASSSTAIKNATRNRKDDILHDAKPFVWKMGNALFYGVSYKVSYKKYKITAYEYVGLSHNTACMLKVRYTDARTKTPGGSLKRYKSYTREAHELFE